MLCLVASELLKVFVGLAASTGFVLVVVWLGCDGLLYPNRQKFETGKFSMASFPKRELALPFSPPKDKF
jgi:hypothetical protein